MAYGPKKQVQKIHLPDLAAFQVDFDGTVSGFMFRDHVFLGQIHGARSLGPGSIDSICKSMLKRRQDYRATQIW